MAETVHHSGLRVSDNGHISGGGFQTGRPWDEVVKGLVKSGVLHLNQGEQVSAVGVDPKYGLYFLLSRLPQSLQSLQSSPPPEREPDGLMARAYKTFMGR